MYLLGRTQVRSQSLSALHCPHQGVFCKSTNQSLPLKLIPFHQGGCLSHLSLAGVQKPPTFCPHPPPSLPPFLHWPFVCSSDTPSPPCLAVFTELSVLFRKLSSDLSAAGYFLWFGSQHKCHLCRGHCDHQMKIRHLTPPYRTTLLEFSKWPWLVSGIFLLAYSF
jgi:hypothetical protein